MNIFKLVGSIFVDAEEANKSLKKTDEKAQGLGGKLLDVGKKAAKFGAAAVAGAGAAAGAIFGVAQKAAASADEIDKMSQKIGLSREAYQEMAYVMELAGADINIMQSGMKSLRTAMDGAAAGTKAQAEKFAALGISVTNADGSMRSAEEVMFDAMGALQGMEDQTQKAILAQELFGKSGTELMPLLNQQAGSIDELRARAHDLGIVMSDDAVDAGVAFTDAFTEVKKIGGKLISDIGVKFMPVMMEVFKWITDNMPAIQEIVGRVFDFLGEMIDLIIPVVKSLIPVVKNVVEAIGAAWDTYLKPILQGFLTFLEGVFSGDMSKVLDGLQEMFENAFNALVEIVKWPINQIIKLINNFIGGLNKIKIPDWVPGVGGKGINIPSIPYLAKGGHIVSPGSVIVGERGPEMLELPPGATVRPLTGGAYNDKTIAALLEEIRLLRRQLADELARAMGRVQVVTDTGLVVGWLAPEIDQRLNDGYKLAGRGVV